MNPSFVGLILNITGAIIIAFPDFPGLKEYMTPKNLRVVTSRLENGETVEKGDTGFSQLVEIINDIVNRIHSEKICVAIQLGGSPYGNPIVKGQFETDTGNIPRTELIEWRVLKHELEKRRDKVRWIGLLFVLSGACLQATQFI